jgi:transposase
MQSQYEIVERHDLTEAEWRRLAPLLPPRATRGRHGRDRRQVLNGILWILATGAQWRDLPERYGPWQTCYRWFAQWARDGTWARVHHALQRTLRSEFELDWTVFCLDSTQVRALKAAAGAAGTATGGKNRRAGRSRARAQSRRLGHQAESRDRRPGPAARRRGPRGPSD